jgi:predicted amidohydrolase YtcJ
MESAGTVGAEIVLLNANVITMDPDDTRAQAIAVGNGKIVAVGSKEEISKLIGKETRIIDIRDKAVLPGFIDAHAHLTYTGIMLSSLDLSGARSISEVLDKVRVYVQELPENKVAVGFGLDEAKYPEKRYPTRFELDEVSPRHYVLIVHVTGHAAVVNTKSLRYLNLSGDEEGVDKDRDTGKMTGVVRDPIVLEINLKLMSLMSDEDLKRAISMAAEDALKVGLTTIHTMGEPLGERNMRLIEEMSGELPVRVLLYPFVTQNIDRDIEANPRKAGLKAMADGAIETHTAALFEPYTDDPATKGMLYYTQESMNELVLKAHEAGIQLAIHCESDESIEQVLNAYENALTKYPKEDHRHRIEHYELATEEQNRRVAKLGVSLCMQPAFIYLWGGADGKYIQYLGEKRMTRAHTYKSLLESGILIAGGSDSTVTEWNPIFGIHSLVNHPNINQRVTAHDALKIFTINGAKIAFEEHKKGSIEVGKFADLVVLSEDPLVCEPDKVKDIDVMMTMVAGNIVYAKQPQ